MSIENEERRQSEMLTNIQASFSSGFENPDIILPFEDVPTTVRRGENEGNVRPQEERAPSVNEVRVQPQNRNEERSGGNVETRFPEQIDIARINRFVNESDNLPKLLAVDKPEGFDYLFTAKANDKRAQVDAVKNFVKAAYGVDWKHIEGLDNDELELKFRLAMCSYRMGRGVLIGGELSSEDRMRMVKEITQFVYDSEPRQREDNASALMHEYRLSRDELEKCADWGMFPIDKGKVLRILGTPGVMSLQERTVNGVVTHRLTMAPDLAERYLGYPLGGSREMIARKMNLILLNAFIAEEKGGQRPLILSDEQLVSEVSMFFRRVKDGIFTPTEEDVLGIVRGQRPVSSERIMGRKVDQQALDRVTALMRHYYTEKGLVSNLETNHFTKQDLENIKWKHFYEMHVSGDPRSVDIRFMGRNVKLTTAISNSSASAGVEFVRAVDKERVAVESLRNLSRIMFESLNEPEKLSNGNVKDLATNLDSNMSTLVHMEVPGYRGVTVAGLIVKWDEFMRRSRTDTSFGDIWNDRSLDAVCGRDASDEMVAAAKIARDIYFVTGGAARYESTRKKVKVVDGELVVNEAEGSYKLSSNGGEIKFRDLYLYPANASVGEPEDFKDYRKLMINGIDLRFFSLWEELERGEGILGFDGGYRSDKTTKVISRTEATYDPLTEEKIYEVARRMAHPLEGLKMKDYMERTEKAWKTMKAEAALLRSPEGDSGGRADKFKELMKEYGHLRGAEKQDVLAARIRAHLDYLIKIYNHPRSGKYNSWNGIGKKVGVLDAYIMPYANLIGRDNTRKIIAEYKGRFDLNHDNGHDRRQKSK